MTQIPDDTSKPVSPSDEDQDPKPPKPRKPIPLIAVPTEGDTIADEMAELFDEDRVTHQHGSSEPEAD